MIKKRAKKISARRGNWGCENKKIDVELDCSRWREEAWKKLKLLLNAAISPNKKKNCCHSFCMTVPHFRIAVSGEQIFFPSRRKAAAHSWVLEINEYFTATVTLSFFFEPCSLYLPLFRCQSAIFSFVWVLWRVWIFVPVIRTIRNYCQKKELRSKAKRIWLALTGN